MLVFRKREDGQEPTARTLQFRSKVTIEQGDTAKTINAFFAENPENVLGTWKKFLAVLEKNSPSRRSQTTTWVKP